MPPKANNNRPKQPKGPKSKRRKSGKKGKSKGNPVSYNTTTSNTSGKNVTLIRGQEEVYRATVPADTVSGKNLLQFEVSPMMTSQLVDAGKYFQYYRLRRCKLIIGHAMPTTSTGKLGVLVRPDPADPNPFPDTVTDATTATAMREASHNQGYSHGTMFVDRHLDITSHLRKGALMMPTIAEASPDDATLRQTSNGQFILVVHSLVNTAVEVTVTVVYEYEFWEKTAQTEAAASTIFAPGKIVAAPSEGGVVLSIKENGRHVAATYSALHKLVGGRTISFGKFISPDVLFEAEGKSIVGFALQDPAHASQDEIVSGRDIVWVTDEDVPVTDPIQGTIAAGTKFLFVANLSEVDPKNFSIRPCALVSPNYQALTVHPGGSQISSRLVRKERLVQDHLIKNFSRSIKF